MNVLDAISNTQARTQMSLQRHNETCYKSLKDQGRLYRFFAQSLIVSGSFCVNFIEYLSLSP